jgi:nucleoid-associated protein YgaU
VIKAIIADKNVAETTVGKDGTWFLKFANESGADVARVKIVLVNAQGAELDSTEYPLKLAVAKPVENASGTLDPSKSTDAAAKVEPPVVAKTSGIHVRVRRGDSLWRIAKRHYGDGRKWTKIYRANRRKLKDPDVILVGRRLYLP